MIKNFEGFVIESKYLDYVLESTDFTVYKNDSGAKFWGNKGAGVLPYCKNTKRFLISYRSKYVNEPNTYGIFGGGIDKDEDPKTAALRELEEELQYNKKIELIDLYVYKTKDFEFYNYLGIVDEEFEGVLDWETESVLWLNYEELLNLKNKHFGLVELLKHSKNEISKNL